MKKEHISLFPANFKKIKTLKNKDIRIMKQVEITKHNSKLVYTSGCHHAILRVFETL